MFHFGLGLFGMKLGFRAPISCSASEILNDGLVKGMDEIGKRWSQNEIFIPEVLIAARAMHAAMAVLQPVLKEKKTEPRGVVVIGTVQGDLHDIGKNLVETILPDSIEYSVIPYELKENLEV